MKHLRQKYSIKLGQEQLSRLRPCLNQEPLQEMYGKWYFRCVNKEAETTDSFDKIKLLFKSHPNLYYLLVKLVSPVHILDAPLKKFFTLAERPTLNLGSGNQPRFPGAINVDMMDYENVDIVCDITRLPFANNSISSIVNIAVLEHLKDPSAVIQEVYRVLKPNGLVLSVVPFMQPFHASPHDYQRYTLPGLEYLHKDFEVVESGVFSGPISGLIWVFQETFASIFSFGSPTLRNLIYIFLLLLTWPIKFLDIFCARLPTAKNVASNFYVVGRKGFD